jgi:hypothetical protein
MLLGTASLKVVRKMLIKLTPSHNQWHIGYLAHMVRNQEVRFIARQEKHLVIMVPIWPFLKRFARNEMIWSFGYFFWPVCMM